MTDGVISRAKSCSTYARPWCSPDPASQGHRFRGHEELLVRRGWNQLEWLTGACQRVSILRNLEGQSRRRLTRTEFDLVSAAAGGLGIKQAAPGLGLEWATARSTISRALRKLGLQSSAQVPAFWYGLCGRVSSSWMGEGTELVVFESRLDGQAPGVSLTNAERDILQAVLMGLNNEEIARKRDTSLRTVANQLAGLFRKSGVSSKGELAAKALLLHWSCEHAPSRQWGVSPGGAATPSHPFASAASPFREE